MTDILPQLATMLGINPSTLVLLVFLVNGAANLGARRIPDDATGPLGLLRKVCAVIGLYASSRLTKDATVADVAKAALATPPIPEKVEETK